MYNKINTGISLYPSPPFFLASFKGRGPGINSSQSKNVGKIQLSMQLLHLSIIFENIWF